LEKQFEQVVAIHGVFAPCEYKNHKFVDGGILDNVPAGEVRKLGADKVLTIKFSAGLNYEPKNVYEIAFKSIDLLFEGRAQEAVKESDYVIDLDLSEASVFNIKKIDYCYNIGYITAIEKMKEIKEMLR
jgi:NTE family protein